MRKVSLTMKYTIGTFSNLLGVTTDTLRLYEKYGILTPEKDDKNNYRYYDDLDARNLLACRWYRSLNFSLKEAAELTCRAAVDDITKALEQKEYELKLQMESIQKKHLVIKETLAILDDAAGIFRVKTWPGLYRFKQTEINTLLETNAFETNQWMEQLPETLYSFKVLLNSDLPYTWGMAMTEAAFEKANLSLNHEIEYLPPSNYLCITHLSRNDEPLLDECFLPLREEAKKRNLCTGNYVFGHLIVSFNKGKDRVNLIELMLPFEKT